LREWDDLTRRFKDVIGSEISILAKAQVHGFNNRLFDLSPRKIGWVIAYFSNFTADA
jgi:hypothetical protein